jgi:hypothetical protein
VKTKQFTGTSYADVNQKATGWWSKQTGVRKTREWAFAPPQDQPGPAIEAKGEWGVTIFYEENNPN